MESAVDPRPKFLCERQLAALPVSGQSYYRRDEIMQRTAIHSCVAVVANLNAFNHIFFHRRADVTNVAGQSRADVESQLTGQNHPANDGELRKRVVLSVKLDGLSKNAFEKLVVPGKKRAAFSTI